jgi:hypothetical protein
VNLLLYLWEGSDLWRGEIGIFPQPIVIHQITIVGCLKVFLSRGSFIAKKGTVRAQFPGG